MTSPFSFSFFTYSVRLNNENFKGDLELLDLQIDVLHESQFLSFL
ncbi:hypothetical protein MADA3029_150012 [Vibrio nigripulchritudo MADA3029]|nr:hypothetical protein VIBNIAM115_1060015 [Vibrio nigripulchritudo AM115]CCN44106.1 hypothetical protein VIBNIFTn2_700061 [Vibrio nigripulchritudo FTn2]CCN58473.1 hypothetical protein MADA3029_150012 [Vibrio nigripulchritudo MADA3029]CCN64306.1 hypothetical protein VIBNIPon4_200063 [Vibrio nigripulchritudo POn4]CCN70752.1 hypothetical protein VIBNISFn118_250012 [Vibrio nigripulchritudo SFn118]CCN76064.1 hypothetical protein VIBNISO65_1510014 [Vibrio nigripulchritudo SO65]